MKAAKIKVFSIAALALLGSSLVAFGAKVGALRGDVSQSVTEDGRRAVALSVAGREAVLSEMRLMMSALHGVLDGLARSDMKQVSASASSAGLGAAVDMDPAVRDSLPPEFVRLGMSTHAGFDSLAAASSGGADGGEILRRAAQLSANCVACHATYKLEVR